MTPLDNRRQGRMTTAPPGAPARLRELRLKAGLSQRDLAERCGIGHRQVSDHELGNATMEWATIRRYAAAVGLTDDAFVEGIPAPHRPLFVWPGFGDRLRTARKAAGLSQFRLGVLASMPPSSVSAHELGRRHPRPQVALRYAKALGMDPKTLL